MYMNLYHVGWEEEPPHERTRQGEDRRYTPGITRSMQEEARADKDDFDDAGYLQQNRRWTEQVLYTGNAHTAANFGRSSAYIHHYRVPHAAIDDLRYGDDMGAASAARHRYGPHIRKNPADYFDTNAVRQTMGYGMPTALSYYDRGVASLFSGVPLSNRHVIASGRVQSYINHVEAPESDPRNFVIPLPHMENLGIQYAGTHQASDVQRKGSHWLDAHSYNYHLRDNPKSFKPQDLLHVGLSLIGHRADAAAAGIDPRSVGLPGEEDKITAKDYMRRTRGKGRSSSTAERESITLPTLNTTQFQPKFHPKLPIFVQPPTPKEV